MQHEITSPIPLLDEEGNLTEPGYARRLLPVYDRSRVRGGLTRLKEWDYYLIMGPGFALALTIADNSYMGMDSVSFLQLEEGWETTRSMIRPLPMGGTGLPSTSETGDSSSAGKGYGLLFRNDHGQRTLVAHVDRFRGGKPLDAKIHLSDPPEESMVICTPFHKPGHFYFNQKINCLRAEGSVTVDGRTYAFSPADSFGTLDWGRGVWTYHNTWYWASASGLVNGIPFGFNLGGGFGDTSAATEHMLFYDGWAHKLDQVTFHIPKKGKRYDYLSPWAFTSRDGRLDLTFQPILDRKANAGLGVLKSDQHQVFGRYSGTAALDDGTVLTIRDLLGFAERVENKW